MRNSADLFLQPEPEYLMCFLIISTIDNALIIIVGYVLVKQLVQNSKLLNYIPTVQLALICLVVASIHYNFSKTLCIFCIPFLITVIFNDKRMTWHVEILSCVFLGIALLIRKNLTVQPDEDVYFLAEAIVAFAILIATALICNVMIKFHEEKSKIIHQGYIRQLEMQEQLNKDQKTGLYGNTIFMNKLNKIVKLSETTNKETNKEIALAIIDVDNFKQINYSYGHLKGDQVLLALAGLTKKRYKKNRFMARFGGEEFSIICMGSEVDHIYDLMENLRIEFENQRYDFMEDTITISIGISTWELGWTAEELFENADAAMYVAKANGKN